MENEDADLDNLVNNGCLKSYKFVTIKGEDGEESEKLVLVFPNGFTLEVESGSLNDVDTYLVTGSGLSFGE